MRALKGALPAALKCALTEVDFQNLTTFMSSLPNEEQGD
jgi:hypothetical protein